MYRGIVNHHEFVGMSELEKLMHLRIYHKIELPKIHEAINSWHPPDPDTNLDRFKNGRNDRDNLAYLVKVISEDSESGEIKRIAREIKSYLKKYCYDHTTTKS